MKMINWLLITNKKERRTLENEKEKYFIFICVYVVTFFICFAGILVGKKFGTKLSGKAGILGGIILLFIGLEIFITSWF